MNLCGNLGHTHNSMSTFIIAGFCVLICIVVIYVSLRILADSRRVKKEAEQTNSVLED